ncbi:MAG: formylglycine-generating enzyme family protein, partial [Planctomycetota bacterium]
QDVLNAYNQGKESTLVLPTAEQWEAACRTGTSNRAYHFTEHRDAEGEQATADSGKQVQVPAQEMLARFAHLHETRSLNEIGPFPVATREADSIGLFDMHGNVWEFCADGSIRGGSWHDAALQARTANSHSIDPHLPHPAVGCRLLLRP